MHVLERESVSVLCENNGGENEGNSHAAGNIAGFRHAELALHCLKIYPPLSQLLVAEAACLLHCLSEWLLVTFLCRPTGSSDRSKEEMIPWGSICWLSLSHCSLREALRAGIYPPSSGWGVCCVTLSASGHQAPRGSDSSTIQERYPSN